MFKFQSLLIIKKGEVNTIQRMVEITIKKEDESTPHQPCDIKAKNLRFVFSLQLQLDTGGRLFSFVYDIITNKSILLKQ